MGQQDWPCNTTGKQHKLTSLQHHLRKHMQAQSAQLAATLQPGAAAVPVAAAGAIVASPLCCHLVNIIGCGWVGECKYTCSRGKHACLAT